MKLKFLKTICLLTLFTLIISSCSIKNDDLEGATIYTTVYPVNYLVKYLYDDYGKISSIYPKDSDINTYKLTEKQIANYSKADLFVYNGLTKEKEIAKTLLNKNKNLLIIDVSYGLSYENDPAELWLSPKNYLMLAKNIKENLTNYLTSKYIIEEVDKNYADFEEKISLMDANLRSIANNAQSDGKNTIVTSSKVFNFLKSYGFDVISLDDEENLKENKYNSIKSKFKNKKYTYILCAESAKENETIKDLEDNNAKLIDVNLMTLSMDDDYFSTMTSFIENIKTALS